MLQKVRMPVGVSREEWQLNYSTGTQEEWGR